MQLLPGPQWFQPRRRFERTAVSREVGGISLEIYWGSWENPTKIWRVKCRYDDISNNFGLKITNLQLPQINFDILMEVCLLKQPGKIHHVIPRFFLSNVGGWVLQKIEEISGILNQQDLMVKGKWLSFLISVYIVFDEVFEFQIDFPVPDSENNKGQAKRRAHPGGWCTEALNLQPAWGLFMLPNS